jgi:hypothetical protein
MRSATKRLVKSRRAKFWGTALASGAAWAGKSFAIIGTLAGVSALTLLVLVAGLPPTVAALAGLFTLFVVYAEGSYKTWDKADRARAIASGEASPQQALADLISDFDTAIDKTQSGEWSTSLANAERLELVERASTFGRRVAPSHYDEFLAIEGPPRPRPDSTDPFAESDETRQAANVFALELWRARVAALERWL